MTCLFVEKLNHVDFCFLDPKRGLLGESWWFDVALYGELDDQGMIFDFGPAKKLIKQRLDEWIDHKLVVPTQVGNLQHRQLADQMVELDWQFAEHSLHTKAPSSSFTFIEAETITPETVSEYVVPLLMQEMPENVQRIELSFYLEQIAGAFYHYSHGLKKHQGNCQRIAHGHRSQIQIFKNGQRNTQLEQHWAQEFEDIHLYTQEDIAAKSCSDITIAYQAPQGEFSLTLPKQRTYQMMTDTTVENIAYHIAEKTKQSFPGDAIKVRAFEGINKGAEVNL